MIAKIGELSAYRLSEYAAVIFSKQGRTRNCTRFIYRGLSLDINEPLALEMMSRFLNLESLEAFSAGILEYACSDDCPIPEDAKIRLADLLFQYKWFWGFSNRADGQKWLRTVDFINRDDFFVDEALYQDWFILPLIRRTGSLRNAVETAHTFLGWIGDCLTHKEFGKAAPFEEIYHPDRFTLSSEYEEWLTSPVSDSNI